MIGWIEQAIDKVNGAHPSPQIIPASLFMRNEQFGLSNLPFDLLISEDHSMNFEITDHTVDTGSTISDHVVEKLRSVTVNGMFTNNSIFNTDSIAQRGNGGTATIREKDSIKIATDKDGNVVQQSATINTSLERWEQLKEIARRRTAVRLVTSLEVYDLMVVQNLRVVQGPESGESIKFVMTLREIRTAKIGKTTQKAVWNPPNPASMQKASDKAMSKIRKNGKVSAEEVDPLDKVDKVARGRGANYAGG